MGVIDLINMGVKQKKGTKLISVPFKSNNLNSTSFQKRIYH